MNTSVNLALRKIETTSVDGVTTLIVSEAPYVAVRWSDLCSEPGPDMSGWSFWCPRCEQCPVWVKDAFGRSAEKGVETVACWSRCYECKLWILLQDREIMGARVLNPEECDVARVMET